MSPETLWLDLRPGQMNHEVSKYGDKSLPGKGGSCFKLNRKESHGFGYS